MIDEKGIKYIPKKEASIRLPTITIDNTAPNAAPADTPINPGSANGFLNNPCKEAPAIPKAAPTIKHKTILGSLILKRISCSSWFKLLFIRSINEKLKLPIANPR